MSKRSPTPSSSVLRVRTHPVSQAFAWLCPSAGPLRSQAAGGRARRAQVQPCRGCGGWSRLFPPHAGLPPAAGWAGYAWEEGWAEGGSKHSHVQPQPGLSKHRFLLPATSAASATVTSGWLTMLAGAGALRLGRVTSLNCHHRELPPAHLFGLPAWGTMEYPAGPENTILGGSQHPALTRPRGSG